MKAIVKTRPGAMISKLGWLLFIVQNNMTTFLIKGA